jgi:hypothetical protein
MSMEVKKRGQKEALQVRLGEVQKEGKEKKK